MEITRKDLDIKTKGDYIEYDCRFLGTRMTGQFHIPSMLAGIKKLMLEVQNDDHGKDGVRSIGETGADPKGDQKAGKLRDGETLLPRAKLN